MGPTFAALRFPGIGVTAGAFLRLGATLVASDAVGAPGWLAGASMPTMASSSARREPSCKPGMISLQTTHTMRLKILLNAS